jgi:hypothetical protein
MRQARALDSAWARLAFVLAAVLFARSTVAGDDCLMIQYDVTRPCRNDCGAPVKVRKTPADALAALERSITVPGVGLARHFSNGTTEFCSQKERLELARGVVALGLRPRLTEEGWWEHMLFVVGPRTSLAEVEARLQSPDLHPRARRRLERAAVRLRDKTRGR